MGITYLNSETVLFGPNILKEFIFITYQIIILISCSKEIKESWDRRMSVFQNLKEMGLSSDPNKTLKTKKTKVSPFIFYSRYILNIIKVLKNDLEKFSRQHLNMQNYPAYEEVMLNIFLAHLSQRLIGELIGYSWSGVRPSASVVRPSVRRKQFQTSSSPKPLA